MPGRANATSTTYVTAVTASCRRDGRPSAAMTSAKWAMPPRPSAAISSSRERAGASTSADVVRRWTTMALLHVASSSASTVKTRAAGERERTATVRPSHSPRTADTACAMTSSWAGMLIAAPPSRTATRLATPAATATMRTERTLRCLGSADGHDWAADVAPRRYAVSNPAG